MLTITPHDKYKYNKLNFYFFPLNVKKVYYLWSIVLYTAIDRFGLVPQKFNEDTSVLEYIAANSYLTLTVNFNDVYHTFCTDF